MSSRLGPATLSPLSFIPPYFSSGCLSVVLNTWRNVDLIGLPGRSTRVVRADFCGRFESDFPLAFRWSGLKLIGYSVVESFDEGVGFSWRAYRNLGTGYTCADSVISSFVDAVGTTTPLVGDRKSTRLNSVTS